MRPVQLTKVLDAPLQWVGSKTHRDAMTLITVSSQKGEKSVLISSRGMKTVDSTDYVVAPKERVTAARNPIKYAFALSSKVAGWSLVAIMLAFAGSSSIGLIDARIVLTGSMSPAINPGDVLVTTTPERNTPEIGDVVIYTGKKFDGTPVASFAHRIIGGNQEIGFTVKGDNNPSPDVQQPTLSEIEGVALFTMPLLGKLLSPQVFILLLVAGFGIWLIVDAFRDEE